MSSLAPGEVDNRVCYACNTTAATPNLNTPVDDDLALQPLEGSSHAGPPAARGNVRRQMERQIKSGLSGAVSSKANLPAVRKSASNAAMPAARAASHPTLPAAKPAGRSTQAIPAVRTSGSTRTNLPAAADSAATLEPAAPAPEHTAPDNLELAPPRVSSARIAPVRSSARHRALKAEARGVSPLVYAVLGVVVLGVAAVIYSVLRSGKENTSVAAAPARTDPPPAARIPPPPAAPQLEVAKKSDPVPAKPQPAAAKTAEPTPPPQVLAVEAATPPAPDEKPAAAAPATPSAPAPQDLFALKRNVQLDDEEALVEQGITPAKKPAPAPAAAKDAAGKDKGTDALAGMGITGKKKTQPEEEAPVFDDIRKPKPVIPVTATEPTIIQEDLTQGDQNPEKQFSQSIQQHLPGWRVRDVTLENTQFTSAEHRGKRDVLILNPMNDTLPAKLYCTVEIPKDYAGRRPMLAFEVSTLDKSADWFLAVKCMSVEVRPKTAIRCPDEAKWIPVGVDLSGLAGKRFELAIEAYMTPRTNNKKWRDERAYIRNVQLLWQGKK